MTNYAPPRHARSQVSLLAASHSLRGAWTLMGSDSWSPWCKCTKWPGRRWSVYEGRCYITDLGRNLRLGSVGEQTHSGLSLPARIKSAFLTPRPAFGGFSIKKKKTTITWSGNHRLKVTLQHLPAFHLQQQWEEHSHRNLRLRSRFLIRLQPRTHCGVTACQKTCLTLKTQRKAADLYIWEVEEVKVEYFCFILQLRLLLVCGWSWGTTKRPLPSSF